LITLLFTYNASAISFSQDSRTLSPDAAPSENFDLSYWNLSIPTDSDNNGRSDTIDEANLNRGFQHPDYFYTAPDGGMVFKVPIKGFKTSNNTSYTRSELREMLRRGDTSIHTRDDSGRPNKNNWVFSSAPAEAQELAGAVDGVLEATLAVNHVTTTGRPKEMGRVIIGQIHAKDDEPIRLYYHKLPQHDRGIIYAAHEPLGKKDQYFDLIGGRRSTTPPRNAFALNEKFSYKIEAKGNKLRVTISDIGGTPRAQRIIDMPMTTSKSRSTNYLPLTTAKNRRKNRCPGSRRLPLRIQNLCGLASLRLCVSFFNLPMRVK